MNLSRVQAAGLGVMMACLVAGATPAQAQTKQVNVAALHLRALDAAAQGDVKGAIAQLRTITDYPSTSPAAERDRARLTLARLLYETKDFDGALAVYDSIDRHGASGAEALEERAWTELALGRPQEAIAHLKSVTSPLYADMANAEAFYALTLSQLRICDFSEVFKSIDRFKDRYRAPLKEWQSSTRPGDKLKLREVSATIQKINLVEAETIQRLYIDPKAKERVRVPAVAKAPGQLSFPAAPGEEVWRDEGDDIRVSVKGCGMETLKQEIAK
jgi:outer membrane protein assembly factor BamD (BamD/ComL family)